LASNFYIVFRKSYIKRGWATLREDSEQKYAVDLTFDKSQLDQFEKFLTSCETTLCCVVCLSVGQLLKKNVVPKEYRKHFPEGMKSHARENVVLLCLKCHALSNEHDFLKRGQLADQYNAPVDRENITSPGQNGSKEARSAGRALVKSYSKLPKKRRLELEKTLVAYFEVEKFTMDLAETASKLVELKIDDEDKENCQHHGLRVVKALLKSGGIEALKNFEASWRQQFVKVMKPQLVHEGWNSKNIGAK